MRLKLAPRIRPLPELGERQVTASQLATNGMDGNPIYQSDHIGRIVAVRKGDTVIAGPLRSVLDSIQAPGIILEIGEFRTSVHPSHPVTVAPDGCRLTVVASRKDGDKA
ncbi:hypothetical protein 7S2_21 [uncultured Caudovirales phage]|uniref:Uncharacterized protein n=1 Tax=uncultured Caudovirales phage TaxID=2100421 RepID=A0A2H4J9S3_9CAUD|nr:hypothetical protein 7S2_21 [uncultured Caudovirales phage]